MTVIPVAALAGEWSIGKVGSLNPGELSTGGAHGVSGTGSSGDSSSFGGALSEAISSLDQTQQSADVAAEGLATGTVTNPESAVVTVENAQMAMELAAQVRTKATEAAQSIFQTQV